MSTVPRYVIVSPVKDEAQYIDLTLTSVVRQTIPPVAWVIVDDGSSDNTVEIIRSYAQRHSFIRLLTSPLGGRRDTGTAEAQAFTRGYRAIVARDYDFIVKLDGDLSFEPCYFERLLGRLASEPRIGIASGVYLESKRTGLWSPVPMPHYHAFGACKVVRRRCFEDIGGFLTRPGWDTVDEIRAWSLGWTTGHFSDLLVKHHRQEGSGMGQLATSVMHGQIYYLTGGDPLFLPGKCLRRLLHAPIILNAMGLAYGYLDALVRRRPRLVTAAEARCYRRLLRRRLWTKGKAVRLEPTES